MSTKIKLRRDIATNWENASPPAVLDEGEIGVDLTNGKFKLGDGTSTWAQLSYFSTTGDFDFNGSTISTPVKAIDITSHIYSELHWNNDSLVSRVNTPSDNFVGVDDRGAYISTVGTDYANTWAFNNDGTLVFPDGTIQTTAYDSIPLDNIGLDGGSASVIYEVSKLFADGGSAGNRFGPNDPIFDGTGAGVVYGPSDLVLNGGVA
jgi:hypothetical protein